MYNVLVIGSVNSTLITLQQLLNHGFTIVGILGYEPTSTKNVSGWVDLRAFANSNSLAFKGFKKINDSENIEWAEEKKPDLIFAIGFSQLLNVKWLSMPLLGCIGFHPTVLPKGRGRAPIAWIVLEQLQGSATFFLMGHGSDDGPIFIQECFDTSLNDDAKSIESKINKAIYVALGKWLPELKTGNWNPIPQNESEASWFGKRAPEDGLINWSDSAFQIDRLIKASSSPHPGAYTYFKDEKVIVWESEIENEILIKGVTGRILIINPSKGLLVQCGNGLIWISKIEYNTLIRFKVGDKFGYNLEDEIFKLKKNIKDNG